MHAVFSAQKIKTRKVSFIAGLLIAAVGLISGVTLTVHRVSAADCDSNAIIYCGFTTASGFIHKVRVNDSLNGIWPCRKNERQLS
jgi:hypothetical protein